MTSAPARLIAIGAAAAVGGAALWWRRNPSACPYGQRFWVEAPHPIITRGRLREVVGLAPGERVLEVGVGTGYYSLPLAEWVGASGHLDLFDLQREMLDHTLASAREAGLAERVTATRGDATSLPYDDDAFDAAVIVATLGEIPDRDAALRELARVVRPGGRVVVGELFGDPHMITWGALRRMAAGAGLEVERRSGPWVGYFARLRPRG